MKKIIQNFKIWKTIKLGTGLKTAAGFRKALKKADCYIGDWGNNILGEPAFTAAGEEKDVELVVVSVTQLGYKDCATRKDIYDRAKELGLDRCPAEVGPQLRLQYNDQRKGEWLLIAMEPIVDSNGDPDIFAVGCSSESERCLYARNGCPDFVWNATLPWVFMRRKQSVS